jgi:lysozyme
MTTEDRAALRAQLIRHEGVRAKVYNDSLGIPTIGCGRNVRDKGLNDAEIAFLLDNDIAECEADLVAGFAWYSALDPIRQRALLDLRFNLGPTRFRSFKNTIASIGRSDYSAAASNLLLSKWATQVQPDRVQRIVRQLRDGTP